MVDSAKRAWRRLYSRISGRIGSWRHGLVASAALKAASRLARVASRLARVPWRDELIPLPAPIRVEGTELDVIGDLCAYTQLPRSDVEREVTSRADLSFRTEWHVTPERLRTDHWFYLSSKGYLFANASHFSTTAFADSFVRPAVEPGGRILEFGGGAGNLGMILAAYGYEISLIELGALQRDFIRHRVARNGLESQVRVLDWWQEPPGREFDAIVAVDVFEHIDALRATLEKTLLPALKPGGRLIENTSFVVNLSNPMHHEDYGFDAHLTGSGLRLLESADDGTRVWSLDVSPSDEAQRILEAR